MLSINGGHALAGIERAPTRSAPRHEDWGRANDEAVGPWRQMARDRELGVQQAWRVPLYLCPVLRVRLMLELGGSAGRHLNQTIDK